MVMDATDRACSLFLFKQKTAYEIQGDWSSDVCSSDLVVVDRLFDGKTQLTRALQPLMRAAETTLHLDQGKRSRTIVRVDAGGGSLDDVNWLLARDYQGHCKDYSGKQAARLAKRVQHWFTDPHQPERQFGWVTEASNAYVRPVKRIAVRCRKPDGK